MDTTDSKIFGLSPIAITAIMCVVIFGGVVWYRASQQVVATGGVVAHSIASGTISASSTTGSEISAALLGSTTSPLGNALATELAKSYASTTASGDYSTSSLQQAGVQFAQNISPKIDYHVYTIIDMHTTVDTSKERATTYRTELQKATAPLFDNKTMELELFGQYLDTKDPSYLTQLSAEAANYGLAVQNIAQVVAPVDAVDYQLAIMNSLSEFQGVLTAMVDNAHDPLASAFLLKSYTTAEGHVVASFQTFAQYAKDKKI